jgi:ankyrin repeat protein
MSELVRDIETNDIQTVRYLIDTCYDLDFEKYNGWTPLELACFRDKHEIVSLLIHAVTKLPGSSGRDLFNEMCFQGNFECVKALIFRYDVNIQNDVGNTPLHNAVVGITYDKDISLRLDLVQFLLNHGSNLKIQNKNGRTPVDEAISIKSNKIINLLQLYDVTFTKSAKY